MQNAILGTLLEAFLNFLWGMETLQATIVYLDSYFPVFELPMRDGNLGFSALSCLLESSFWTSYEGWKRRWRERCMPICLSFWTSYEGWKQKKLNNIIAKTVSVFELPMRDGNFWAAIKGYRHGGTFLNFLWGMETATWPNTSTWRT